MHELIIWQDTTVDVQARLVPRYLWSTASIEVYLNGERILRTGGQMKFTGSHTTTFTHSRAVHTMELNWGMSGFGFSFPYQLSIDGVVVSTSRAKIHNWPLGFAAAMLMAVVGVMMFYFIHGARG